MYDHILIPTDGSETANAAARVGAVFADAFDASVHVLSVVDVRSYSSPLADLDQMVREQRELFEERAEDAVTDVETVLGEQAAGIGHVSRIEHGIPSEVISEYAAEHEVDLVVMGSQGRSGLDRLLVGSVAERVLRTSDAPVLIVPPAADDREFDSVLIPTDGSEAAQAAVEHGISTAGKFDASLHVLHVIRSGRGLPGPSDPLRVDAEGVVESVAAEATGRSVDVETHVQAGNPAKQIRRFVTRRGMDMVAMGTHGRSGLSRYLLGSVTEKVVRTSDVPLLTVRSGES